MYGGANETRYANDIEDIIDEVYKRPSQMRTVNSAFFSATRLLTLQTRLSAAYKGIMALLYKADCRDFMDNSKMNLVNSVILSPDIHHIFPEAYCQKVGIKRQKYNSIVNKTPILPPTNRSIESHMINFEYLEQDDFDNYFIDRAKKLLNLIENAMGKNVSDRGSEDTIEQFGKSLI